MRERDTRSFSLLTRFTVAPESVGGPCCTSCDDEKRLKDLEKTAVALLIANKARGLSVAWGGFQIEQAEYLRQRLRLYAS